jgi:hypothetical protein
MTIPSPTQAEVKERAREIAHRIVADFRPEGWSAKEEEITRLIISAFAEQCATDRIAVVEECARVTESTLWAPNPTRSEIAAVIRTLKGA